MSDFNFESNDPTPVVVDHNINIELPAEPAVEVETVIETPVVAEAVAEHKDEEKTLGDKTSVLYAIKDLKIMGLGTLKKGYNTVSAGKVNKWLEKASVRIASAEEIKTYHNK
jgi:hypothetical protein